MPALAIRQDRSADELRRLARHEPDRRAAMRLLVIANALEGMSRAEAARPAGMGRQALRGAVVRSNAEGPRGLHDRARSDRPEGLGPGQQAALKAWVLRGPDPEQDGVGAWRRTAAVCAHAEEAHPVGHGVAARQGDEPAALLEVPPGLSYGHRPACRASRRPGRRHSGCIVNA